MRDDGEGSLLFCLADCLLSCIESMVEYFNKVCSSLHIEISPHLLCRFQDLIEAVFNDCSFFPTLLANQLLVGLCLCWSIRIRIYGGFEMRHATVC
jgi:hypothetical protein